MNSQMCSLKRCAVHQPESFCLRWATLYIKQIYKTAEYLGINPYELVDSYTRLIRNVIYAFAVVAPMDGRMS